MPHASPAALTGRVPWVLAVFAPLATAGDPCDDVPAPQLLGPQHVFVADLQLDEGTARVDLQALDLAPLPGVDTFAFVSADGGPLAPLASAVAVDVLAVDVPVELLGASQLEFLAVNYEAATGALSCASDPLLVSVLPGSETYLVSLGGELRTWHTVELDVLGPESHEQALPNPFLDVRLEVEFEHVATHARWCVPGFYAADGDAAETSATGGDVWRARFTPHAPGLWSWTVSFRAGPGVAVDPDPHAGAPDALLDGLTGTFVVEPSDKTAPDFRAAGRLEHTGEHWLRFAGDGRPFLKGGVNSPENLLAFADFDATTPTHHYAPHLVDALPDDPTWQGGRGAALLGGLNYLSAQGLNAIYFLTFNVGGDGDDVWPWTSKAERLRFDVSKLAQWERVFTHMDTRGLLLHVVTQETEIGEALGPPDAIERRLYYRELVARFGHHLGLTWNLGEEIANSNDEIEAFAATLQDLDPYDHPVVVHTFPHEQHLVYPQLLDEPSVQGASLQSGLPEFVHAETLDWLAQSAAAPGPPWLVCVDEVGPWNVGAAPDGVGSDPNHDGLRADVLWGNLMAGGGGVEWYFGYAYPNDDLDCEDWRPRQLLWDQTRHALHFFQAYLPFTEMHAADALLKVGGDYALAEPGEVYACYDRDAASEMRLLVDPGTYTVHWYDPELGGPLQEGTLALVKGPGAVKLGLPPFSGDAVALVRRAAPGDDHVADPESEPGSGEPPPLGDGP